MTNARATAAGAWLHTHLLLCSAFLLWASLAVGQESADKPSSAIVPLPGRFGHAAIYDPLHDRIVVFGGADAGPFNNVWVLALSGNATWSALAPSGNFPSARKGHTAIYDPVRDRMVVFGGWNGSNYSNDVWALSLSESPAWTALTPTGTPPSGRYGHTAIYDPVRDRMVVFGGHDEIGSRQDVWTLTLSGSPAWSALAPTGTVQSARYGHTAVYDPVRDRMVVFGGYDATNGTRNDAEALSLAGSSAWSTLAPSGHLPSPRYGHTAIYDRTHDRMLVFGGSYADVSRNDVWALSLSGSPAWSALAPAASRPPARDAHTASYDSSRVSMVVIGGHDADHGTRNDAWGLSLSEHPAWSMLGSAAGHAAGSAPGSSSARNAHAKPSGPYLHTRQGIYLGLGLARGSADLSSGDVASDRLGGWGGSFRLGYVVHPKFAIGIESNTWVAVEEGTAVTLGTFTGAVTVFPAQGLVLRAGYGGSDAAGAGGGVSGEIGSGWTAGAAYEFRLGRTFAVGPQLDYSHVKLTDVEFNYFNVGLSMNWYFMAR